MGMKILLAIDESKSSEAATQALIRQMRSDDVEVCVLHAIEPLLLVPEFSSSANVQNLVATEQARKEQAKKLVAGAEQSLRKAGFQAETLVEEAEPRTAILDQAAKWKADLIVVGSHGHKGLDRFLIGSVAEYVARHAACSVEIVRLPGLVA
jgi:nucleotide-binding universal stress UspA family protein